MNPITRLLEKRKQLLSVQQSLDTQKDLDEYKESQFKRREENLRKKDLELQEALLLFNKFLKENEIKRRRAEQRANEEIKKRLHWVSNSTPHTAQPALVTARTHLKLRVLRAVLRVGEGDREPQAGAGAAEEEV